MALRHSNLALALPLVFGAATLKADDITEADLAIADQQIDTPVEVAIVEKEAWDLADDYALENPVVAIALYAPENDPRTQKAQALLEGWFAQRDIPTETFIGVSDSGIGASYYVKGLAFGPTVVNPKFALPKMEEAARLFPSAWEEELAKQAEEKQLPAEDYIAAIN